MMVRHRRQVVVAVDKETDGYVVSHLRMVLSRRDVGGYIHHVNSGTKYSLILDAGDFVIQNPPAK